MAAIFQKKTPSPNKIRSPSSHQTSPYRFKFLISSKTKEKSQVITLLLKNSNFNSIRVIVYFQKIVLKYKFRMYFIEKKIT